MRDDTLVEKLCNTLENILSKARLLAKLCLQKLGELGDHPFASAWDHGLANCLCHDLNTMQENWASIEAHHIAKGRESSDLPIDWIGVKFGTLSFEEGSIVALSCCKSFDSHGICDYHIEIQESSAISSLIPIPSFHHLGPIHHNPWHPDLHQRIGLPSFSAHLSCQISSDFYSSCKSRKIKNH